MIKNNNCLISNTTNYMGECSIREFVTINIFDFWLVSFILIMLVSFILISLVLYIFYLTEKYFEVKK